MAEQIQKVRQTTLNDGATTETERSVLDPVYERDHRQNVAARVVWFIASVIIVLLAFRFVLALLGANPANGFANFIYSASNPFVKPFFSLFSYNYTKGSAHFEVYTLVAMAVYAIIAWGLARLFTLNRHDDVR